MQPYRLLGVWLVLTYALSGGTTAHAQAAPSPDSIAGAGDSVVVTLDQARHLALIRNPLFLADRQALSAAEGQFRQARALAPNPVIAFQSRGAPHVGSGAFEATLTQELEIGGQRGARVRAARSGVGRAEAGVRDAARHTIARVSVAYYEASAGRERLEIARRLLGLNEQLVRATRIQLAEGEISRLEANLAEIELGRARALVLSETRAVQASLSDMERLTGTLGIVPARPVSEGPDALAKAQHLDALMDSALARRPDLQASEASLDEAEALESLARRQTVPNVTVGAVAERDEIFLPGRPAPSPRIGLVVSTNLPFWNRNQGAVDEREALSEEARLRRAGVELAVRTEVETAYRAYQAAAAELEVFERDVLQPAQANQALLDAAFTSGKIGLPTLLLLRNQLLDAEFGYWDAWVARERAQIALESATGGWDFPTPDSLEDR